MVPLYHLLISSWSVHNSKIVKILIITFRRDHTDRRPAGASWAPDPVQDTNTEQAGDNKDWVLLEVRLLCFSLFRYSRSVILNNFLKRTYTETNDWILLHMFRLVQNNKLIRTQLKSLPLISRVRSLKLTWRVPEIEKQISFSVWQTMEEKSRIGSAHLCK